MYQSVPVDCVVILAFEGVSRHPVRNNWNLPTLSRFTQPRPAYLAGKVALYTTDKLGNVRTHLSLRKLKPNNKEKNYAIYSTGVDVTLQPRPPILKSQIFYFALLCYFWRLRSSDFRRRRGTNLDRWVERPMLYH